MSRTAIKGATLVIALTLFTACSRAPRVDASSQERIQASLEEVTASLPEEEQDKFSAAVGILIRNALGGGYRDVGDTAEGRAKVRAALNGKTAEDIIADAEEIRKQEIAKERQKH